MAKKKKHWSECTSEAEEARWWDENPDYVTEALRTAEQEGRLVRTPAGVAAMDVAPAAIPDQVDVRAIREKLGLSQSTFARKYGFNPRTVQDWEQGRRKPDSAVRAYLTVIDRNPKAVEKSLRKSA